MAACGHAPRIPAHHRAEGHGPPLRFFAAHRFFPKAVPAWIAQCASGLRGQAAEGLHADITGGEADQRSVADPFGGEYGGKARR